MEVSEKKVLGKDCPIGRLSFPALKEPKAGKDGGEAKFKATLLIDKSKYDIKKTKLWEVAIKVGKDHFGSAFKTDGKTWPKGFKTPFRDGDEEKDTTVQPEYEGTVFVGASSRKRPVCVDQELSPVGIEDIEEVMYPGCYARFSVIAFAYDVSGNKGVSFALTAIQKVRDGERLGGGAHDVQSEFTQVESSEEEDAGF